MAAPAGGSVRDIPRIESKLQRTLKVFDTNFNPSWDCEYHLVACSAKHGAVFAASTDGFLAVFRVAELLYKTYQSRVSVELPEEPSRIAVNCDGELLAVAGSKKAIFIYKVKDFWDQNVSPTLAVPFRSSTWVRDMQWSPSMSEILAVGLCDKTAILHVGTGERNEIDTGVVRLCWSPSGSSLVVGHTGRLCVYSPDLSLENTIPTPTLPLPGKARLTVAAMHWMSNNQFAVVYCNGSTGRRQSVITLFNARDEKLSTSAEYVGRLESDTVWTGYNLLQVKPWNVMVCWPALKKADFRLLPPGKDSGDSQAPVQLLRELLCLYAEYPVGVALDRVPILRPSPLSRFYEHTDETMTVLHVLTRKGDLLTYVVVPPPLPPLAFHSVHGENIMISPDGSVARRVESSGGGVAFTARPVSLHEEVRIRILEISNNGHGVIGFGFTNHDPATMTACPDLTNEPGNWAKALDEKYCEKGDLLFFNFTSRGDVEFSVNLRQKGIFFSGVDTRSPLWALFYMYGKCIEVEFYDVARRRVRGPDRIPVKDERLLSGMRALSVDDPPQQLRYQSPHKPLSLPESKGRNQFRNSKEVGAKITGATPTAPTAPQQLRELAGSAPSINASGGTVLADSLPPQKAGHNAYQRMTPSAPLESNERERDVPSTSRAHDQAPSEIGDGQLTECIICYVNPKDSVLSKCGHICMCYGCAVQQWRREGGGRCPLCRARIQDVIRAYVV